MKTTGERIKQALNIRNMIQADLVEKTGLTKSAISSYINERYEPKQQAIYLLAKALEVNPAWLMGYEVDMELSDESSECETTTIAAHATEDLTEKEMEEVKNYIKYLKSKRK